MSNVFKTEISADKRENDEHLIPNNSIASGLTGALTGILSAKTDMDQAKEEMLNKKYSLQQK